MLAVACGGDAELTEDRLADKLVDSGALVQDVADCVSAKLFDELSDKQLKQLDEVDLKAAEQPSQAIQLAMSTAVAECVATTPPGE
jgi:hypothetical protein